MPLKDVSCQLIGKGVRVVVEDNTRTFPCEEYDANAAARPRIPNTAPKGMLSTRVCWATASAAREGGADSMMDATSAATVAVPDGEGDAQGGAIE